MDKNLAEVKNNPMETGMKKTKNGLVEAKYCWQALKLIASLRAYLDCFYWPDRTITTGEVDRFPPSGR